jgi:hypothetical protein
LDLRIIQQCAGDYFLCLFPHSSGAIFLVVLQAIFLNVVSGFELTETAGDLAIAASICSR